MELLDETGWEGVVSGFVINNLLFTTTKKAIIIRRNDRKELPHLSVFFHTASGEIDGHLKHELAAPGTEAYTPLFKFPAAELSNFETEVGPQLEREFRKLFLSLKKATPAWLRRNRYVLAFSLPDAVISRIPDFAPKSGGKHRVDLERLRKLFVDDPQITLLDPSALHSEELKNHKHPVFAVRRRGDHKMLSLVYAPSRYGTRVWLISNPASTAMSKILMKAVSADARQKAKEVWYKIHDALQLAQLGITRD